MLETATILRATESKLIMDFGNEVAALGANFFVYDTELNMIQHCDGQKFVSDFESVPDAVRQVLKENSSDIKIFSSNSTILTAELRVSDSTIAIILIDTGYHSDKTSGIYSDDTNPDADEKSVEYLRLLLKMFVANFVMNYKGQQQVELVRDRKSVV